jgi:hypothetical protein
MKIISATAETPGVTKEQVDMFLEGKFMLQMYPILADLVNITD